jgi:hypothetical protein
VSQFQLTDWDAVYDVFDPIMPAEAVCFAVIGSRFRLITSLGRGSFGRGWRGLDLTNGEEVFVKVFCSPLVIDNVKD